MADQMSVQRTPLTLRWVQVRDTQGRVHLEARWSANEPVDRASWHAA